MSKQFDWSDKESVVVQAVSAIAVYRNIDEDFVIRQQDTLGEEDSVIVIPQDRVMDILHAFQAEVNAMNEDAEQ